MRTTTSAAPTASMTTRRCSTRSATVSDDLISRSRSDPLDEVLHDPRLRRAHVPSPTTAAVHGQTKRNLLSRPGRLDDRPIAELPVSLWRWRAELDGPSDEGPHFIGERRRALTLGVG